MYHPALTSRANDNLRAIFSHDDCRLNTIASRLELSTICPDRIVFHPTDGPHADDLLSFCYGSRTLWFKGRYHPLHGFIVDSHTLAPLTKRAATSGFELVVPLRSLVMRLFIFK